MTLTLKNSSVGREPPFRGLQPGSRGITIVRSRYQETSMSIEDIEGWERLSVIL
jgi:hypothetical protein